MKKTIILAIGILTLCIINTFSQTEQEERNYLSEQYQKNKITQQEYANMGKCGEKCYHFLGVILQCLMMRKKS